MAKQEYGRQPTMNIAPFGLRMQPELKEKVIKSAYVAGRSLNAEIVDRLEASFEGGASKLPPFVQDAVDDEIAARGGTPEEALTRLVLLGQSKGGTVFQITLEPGTKMQDISAVIEAARVVVPPNADVFMERK